VADISGVIRDGRFYFVLVILIVVAVFFSWQLDSYGNPSGRMLGPQKTETSLSYAHSTIGPTSSTNNPATTTTATTTTTPTSSTNNPATTTTTSILIKPIPPLHLPPVSGCVQNCKNLVTVNCGNCSFECVGDGHCHRSNPNGCEICLPQKTCKALSMTPGVYTCQDLHDFKVGACNITRVPVYDLDAVIPTCGVILHEEAHVSQPGWPTLNTCSEENWAITWTNGVLGQWTDYFCQGASNVDQAGSWNIPGYSCHQACDAYVNGQGSLNIDNCLCSILNFPNLTPSEVKEKMCACYNNCDKFLQDGSFIPEECKNAGYTKSPSAICSNHLPTYLGLPNVTRSDCGPTTTFTTVPISP
jgi:hypothetical protein